MIRQIARSAAKLSAGAARAISQVRRLLEGRPSRPSEPVESRRELSERYLRELQELVDDNDIDLAAAERIRSDLLEPGPDGDRLKLSTYESYLNEQAGGSARIFVHSRGRDGRDRDPESSSWDLHGS